MASPDDSDKSRRRVLIVEDDLMIRMLLEDMLMDLGYAVAFSVGRMDEAIALARDGDFDLAVLDVNVGGEVVYPVADVLAGRGVPFAFSTGYGDRGMPEAYGDRPTLQKPFQLDGLEKALARLVPKAE